jgi:hypothetical protein
MGLSSFNAMRARERAKLQAQTKVEVETKTEPTSDENLIELEEVKTEKKKTDAEKLKKKGM